MIWPAVSFVHSSICVFASKPCARQLLSLLSACIFTSLDKVWSVFALLASFDFVLQIIFSDKHVIALLPLNMFVLPSLQGASHHMAYMARHGIAWHDYIATHDISWHFMMFHHITFHYITSYYIALDDITLHYITLPYLTLHYITLHCITLHYITLHYSRIQYSTVQHSTVIALHYIIPLFHYIHCALHYNALHGVTLHGITLRYMTFHDIYDVWWHYISFTLHYSKVHYTTSQYIKLHYKNIAIHDTSLH